MNWAFVDYENVGALEGLKLADYERVFVFCGPKNPRVKLGAPTPDTFCKVELIGVSTIAPNNLDFHLAFHLGRFHEVAGKEVTFYIVSSDHDFDGLVHHLKRIGRPCKIVSLTAKSLKPVAKEHTFSASATFIMDRLKAIDGRKRPRKTEQFINWIKNQCLGKNYIAPAEIYDELVKAMIVRVSGTDVSYVIKP